MWRLLEGGPGEGSERILKIVIFANLIFLLKFVVQVGVIKKDPGRGGKVVK